MVTEKTAISIALLAGFDAQVKSATIDRNKLVLYAWDLEKAAAINIGYRELFSAIASFQGLAEHGRIKEIEIWDDQNPCFWFEVPLIPDFVPYLNQEFFHVVPKSRRRSPYSAI